MRVSSKGLVLLGSAHTYYIKQLVQQAVMAATSEPILANEIEVVGRPTSQSRKND